ncbi:MAG: hypothetical protein ACTSSG_11320 [Candidatus Heimdallarchaeaceae archaeon]
MKISSTLARINKELYHQLQKLAFQKHKNARSTKTELEKAVKEYLAKHEQEKEN